MLFVYRIITIYTYPFRPQQFVMQNLWFLRKLGQIPKNYLFGGHRTIIIEFVLPKVYIILKGIQLSTHWMQICFY